MAVLTSSGSFAVTAQSSAVATTSALVMPAVSYPNGQGKIVHPTLGAFDYEFQPDQWVNIDGDVIVMPTYAATKSLSGSSSSLWPGSIQDIICEERWLSLGGLGMPISQLRTLLACAMNPIDPAVGNMQWYPNYSTDIGYNVLMLDVMCGSGGNPTMAQLSGFKNQGIALDDIINGVATDGNGWVDSPVTVYWKILSKVTV